MDRAAFDRVVEAMLGADDLRMRSLLASGPHGAFRHDFTADGPTDLRSISKLVVALAVGAASGHGVRLRGRPLSADLPIAPLLADHLPPAARGRWARVRLHHLLTNTAGFDEGFLFRADLVGRDPDTLLDHVLSRELVHPPGAHFAYTNAGWYLISALVTEASGVSLGDLVAEHLLAPLGIADVGWVRYGRLDAAGTGLVLSAADLHAVGTLLAGDGGGVVPAAWIDAVRSPAVPARCPDDLGAGWRPTAYGYGTWVRADGLPFCYGRGGRLLAVDPRTGTVVTAVAEAGGTAAVTRCLRGAF